MSVYRLYVGQGYGNSLGNMLDALSGQAQDESTWIEVEQTAPGEFTVVGDNFTSSDTTLGFSSWDDEVSDLDCGRSDEAQCFGMSNRLRWKDVIMEPQRYRASSVRKLKEALKHVVFCAWDPMDI